ncbi:YbaN family protein [uncultured Nitratireductor sp.]|uniref:YbaN family protein n=1 Tax=uncultured Nitratireductor sp. TaxID=520953 RepID=UPI0025E15EE6|nr:YbaN family protein [uncultured Nitratireductor sp.]
MKIAPAFENAKRILLLVMGLLMLLLALVGAFLPIMPTTIFLILAAWFFARSSPALERKLLEHPKFGPVLRNWRDRGVMPRRAKLLAAGGIATGYVLFILIYAPGLTLAVAIAAAMGAIAVWIALRPED